MKNADKIVVNKSELQKKLTKARATLLITNPFYGSLLMRLKFGLADCGTACTDMKRILFDPEYLSSLSMSEVDFILRHEILHAVLAHPLRGKDKIHVLYNIAADIVVNANIMRELGLREFEIAGEKVVWHAPDHKSGYLYTAEQVYNMLIKTYADKLGDIEKLYSILEGNRIVIDNHDIWKKIPLNSLINEEWKLYIKEASRIVSTLELPPCIRQFLDEDEVEHSSIVDWRAALIDFIQVAADKYDYSFHPADRRYSETEFILPGFFEIEEERLENLWFLVDTSGSIDDRTLTGIFMEIKACIEQFATIEGKISFFDTSVSEPVNFRSFEDIQKIEPIGGGGTSFRCIFKYMRDEMCDNLPVIIIILTDGHAVYPEEKETLGIPVLWLIVNNEKDAPFGKTIHFNMFSESEC